MYLHCCFALKRHVDSQVAVAFQPAGQSSIAAALERILRDTRTTEQTGAIELPLVCFAELVPLGSLVEPVGRVVLERRVAVVRPFSLKFLVSITAHLHWGIEVASVPCSHAHKFVRMRNYGPIACADLVDHKLIINVPNSGIKSFINLNRM